MSTVRLPGPGRVMGRSPSRAQRQPLGLGLGRAIAVVALAAVVSAGGGAAALAAPRSQTNPAGAPTAAISYVRAQGPTSLFGQPSTAAYVQVFDRADPPTNRTALAGLPASAFSVAEDGRPVAVTARPVAPDEPVALIVVADTSNDRRWLVPGPKYADPLLYLRDAATKVLRELPENGRYAVYSMSGPMPPLADRTAALNAAAQLQPSSEPRLLERLERAVEALQEMPAEWRRIVVVLSDGNSVFGRSYEIVQGTANKGHVAVFSVGTIDPNQAFPFLERLAQETGGQSWLFDKNRLQPDAASPVLLDVLVGEVVKAIKSAYRLEFNQPNTNRDSRELVVTVKTAPTVEVKSKAVAYRSALVTASPLPLILGGAGLLVLVAAGAAGFLYVTRYRAAKTDYYLIGHGPSIGHVPEEYLYTTWRPLGRGGRGYQLKPEDPHFAGISKTHVYLRVHHWRRVKSAGGVQQTVGAPEVRAGRPSSGVGLNTAFVYNELTGLKVLGERPYQLQTGDLLILQGLGHTGDGPNGLPEGVYLRLGYVHGTTAGYQPSQDDDPNKTVVDTVIEDDRTMVESDVTMIESAPAVGGRPPTAPPSPPPSNGSAQGPGAGRR